MNATDYGSSHRGVKWTTSLNRIRACRQKARLQMWTVASLTRSKQSPRSVNPQKIRRTIIPYQSQHFKLVHSSRSNRFLSLINYLGYSFIHSCCSASAARAIFLFSYFLALLRASCVDVLILAAWLVIRPPYKGAEEIRCLILRVLGASVLTIKTRGLIWKFMAGWE